MRRLVYTNLLGVVTGSYTSGCNQLKATYLKGFLVEAGAAILIQDALLAEHPIDHSARLLDVVVLDEHRARQEASVFYRHRFICNNTNDKNQCSKILNF